MTLDQSRDGAQPSRASLGQKIGACACGVCGWRAWKLPAMLMGWDADDEGTRVVCSWCRRRGYTTADVPKDPGFAAKEERRHARVAERQRLALEAEIRERGRWPW